MIFVTADHDRTQLETLTKLLVSTFPGSTIYQHTDLRHASRDVLENKVSAVFLASEQNESESLELVQLLHRCRPDTPVFLLSHSAAQNAAPTWGPAKLLQQPLSEQSLKDAIRSINKEGE